MNASNLSDEPPMEGPTLKFTTDMVSKMINEIKAGKADGSPQ